MMTEDEPHTFRIVLNEPHFVDGAAHVCITSNKGAILFTDYDADLGPEQEGFPSPIDAIGEAIRCVDEHEGLNEVVVSFKCDPGIWATHIQPATGWRLSL